MSDVFTSARVPSDEPNSFDVTARKIISFGELPAGWHYGRGIPVPGKSVIAAMDFLYYFVQLGFSVTDAFPGSDGEIAVTAYQEDFFLRVGLEADGVTEVLLQEGEHDILSEDGITVSQAYTAIEKCAAIMDKKCVTSDSFIQIQSTFYAENSITTPSNPLVRTNASRSFSASVLSPESIRSARIFEDFIQEFPESHRFSGSLTSPPSDFRQMVGV